jgi:hypothetical protein
MNARAKRGSRRQIGRAQASPTAGRVTRTVQEAINTGEAISIGAVNLVTNTPSPRFPVRRTLEQKRGR